MTNLVLMAPWPLQISKRPFVRVYVNFMGVGRVDGQSAGPVALETGQKVLVTKEKEEKTGPTPPTSQICVLSIHVFLVFLFVTPPKANLGAERNGSKWKRAKIQS